MMSRSMVCLCSMRPWQKWKIPGILCFRWIRKRTTHIGSENTPSINIGKGDFDSKSCEPPSSEEWAWSFRASLVGKKRKKRKNYVGSENTPHINYGKGDTLAQRAVSLPHRRVRGKLVWVWWVSGSMRPQGTSVMLSFFIFNGMSGRGHGQYR
eukprot:1139935-Pelagomonas_calceolata.AAC.1